MTTETPAPTPAAPPTPPSTPAEATTRLDQLKADPKWTTALLSGGPAQTKEFHDLHELVAKGDGVDQAISGTMPTRIIQDSTQFEMASMAAHLKELGIRAELVREYLTGHTTTKGWYDEVARHKADRMRDPAFVKALFSGSVEARRTLTLCNIVLSGEITESSA
jgi:hypothetical protein